jgi:hyaluronan synthase
MTSIALDIVRVLLGWLFVSYTILAVSHFVIQMVYAHRVYKRQSAAAFAEAFPDLPVDVDVIVPVYNEDPDLLDRCVRSALAQVHPGRVHVIVVDDGSSNRARLDPVYDALELAGATVIRSPRNIGKRHAQVLALPAGSHEIIVTLDSDTIIPPEAISRLTRQFGAPGGGPTTGFVDVENHSVNLLTRLQRLRYWMAFNQERAAQSWFRTMLCCSGPLAAYRRSILEDVQEAYISQMYGGVACTFGDDRHLTNLVLNAGYDTVFDGGAIAYTDVPEKLPQFIRQQLRWSKSFYRELIWTLPFIGRRPWFIKYDVACQVAMPMMLTFTATSALMIGLLSDPATLLRYVFFIVLAASLRATYGAFRQRDLRFYLFSLYGFASAFMMMSVRLFALHTLTDARWGTRGPARLPGSLGSGLVLSPAMKAGGMAMLVPPGESSPVDSAWRAGLTTQVGIAESAHATATTPLEPARDAIEHDGCSFVSPPGARFCRACGRAPHGSGQLTS